MKWLPNKTVQGSRIYVVLSKNFIIVHCHDKKGPSLILSSVFSYISNIFTWNFDHSLTTELWSMLKISHKNIEKCKRKPKKGSILIMSWLVLSCHSYTAWKNISLPSKQFFLFIIFLDIVEFYENIPKIMILVLWRKSSYCYTGKATYNNTKSII